MKAAFDTNVVLDAIAHRPDFETAEKLMQAVGDERIEGILSANTLTDLYYISRKRLGHQRTREVIWTLMTAFTIAPVDEKICRDALALPMEDYEDAVLAASVKRAGAEFIVTRDREFQTCTHSPVPAISPEEALARIEDNTK